jgi:hypothetical protein
MSLLRKVLAGVGSYLVKEHERQEAFDMQAARDQLLFDRDVALKAVEHGYHVQEQETALANSKDLDTTQTANAMVRDKAAAGYKIEADEASDKRDLAKAVVLKNLDFSSSKALEAVKHKYNLEEGAADDARELQKQLKLNGVTVDHWEVTTDGRLAAFNKNGGRLAQSTKSGTFQTRPGGDTSLSDLLGSGGGGGGGGAAQERTAAEPTPKAPTQGQSKQRAAALAALGTAYAQASQNPGAVRSKYPALFDANGNLRPQDELIGQVNARYGAQ